MRARSPLSCLHTGRVELQKDLVREVASMIEILASAPREEMNPWGAALVFGGLAAALLWAAYVKYRDRNGGSGR